jgi:hypothetical protein
MPLEGHWQRTHTPLRKLTRRERGAATAMVAVTGVALAAILLVTAGDRRPEPAPGCIETVVAGRVGGEPVSGCGAEARAICTRAARFDDPRAEKIVEVCGERGIRFGGAAAGG